MAEMKASVALRQLEDDVMTEKVTLRDALHKAHRLGASKEAAASAETSDTKVAKLWAGSRLFVSTKLP